MFHQRVCDLKPRHFYEMMMMMMIIINASLLLTREVLEGLQKTMYHLVMNEYFNS